VGQATPRRQLVVRSVSALISQSPATLVRVIWTVWVQAWAPSSVTVHSEPLGACRPPVFTDFTTYCPKTTTVAESWDALTYWSPISAMS
jgi:hypothetical protein